ncbi:probable low affinity copper uptake protein 2 isoform X1 [Chiloscyllium plagiosum]|uniref:probable low affinity copper uptake protein 2 isoform X1 n=1 Tax=Chiloscyllium plagiosum TaxID=36176 RepID=UPI001CB7C95A|nr:probable low affinity copper uptake protein 2 isoform X1 [Chiloscyllium plagiosum]
MMPMYFFASDQVVLLFDFWNIHSVAGMVLTVVIVLLMTVLYEMLKVETVKLDKKILDLMASPPNPQDETAETLPINPNSQKTSCKRTETATLRRRPVRNKWTGSSSLIAFRKNLSSSYHNFTQKPYKSLPGMIVLHTYIFLQFLILFSI